MGAQHTPGPWLAMQNCIGAWEVMTHRDHETADDWLGFSAALNCGAMIAGSIGDHTEARTRGNEEANAHLIAAAPELLEALEELDDCIGNGCSDERWDKACDKARAAIAKATGAA